MRHLRLDRLVNLSLAEWAETDAEWWTEVVTLLSAYHEGLQMREGVDRTRRDMQC